MVTTLEQRTALTGFSREAVEQLSRVKNEPEWLREWRLAAWEAYERLPMPQRTDEEWRRTDFRALKFDRLAPFAGVGERVDALDGLLSSVGDTAVSDRSERAGINIQRDGSDLYTEISDAAKAQGVIYCDLDTAVREHADLIRQHFMTTAVTVDSGKFEALHAALWQGGTFLYVPKNVVIEHPFRAFTIGRAPGAALFTHTLVVLEENAEAFVVDAFNSETQEGQAMASGVVELILGKGTKLRYVQVQDWGRHVWNFMTERAVLAKDATINSLHVTLGSKWSKNSIASHLKGENTLAEMLGIFFADSDQFFDHHTWQLHESPYTTSDLEFKGALRDNARSVYSGLIKVWEGAHKTDAYHPDPRNRRQRCSLHPRRHRFTGRPGAYLLLAGTRYSVHRGAEVDRRGLFPPCDRSHPGRGNPGFPGIRHRPQSRPLTGKRDRADASIDRRPGPNPRGSVVIAGFPGAFSTRGNRSPGSRLLARTEKPMALQTQTETRLPGDRLDGVALRADFPILNQPIANGQQRLVFLDSAASSQKPESVIRAMDDFYRTTNANIHRGVYQLSERATAAYEQARHLVADFINARSPRECIFVRNTTEAINLVAATWGRQQLNTGDLIVVSWLEHHSNLVPWQLIAEQTGARIAAIPITGDGVLDLDALDDLLAQEPKLVAVGHVSNSLGTINDVTAITRRAKAAGATVLIDGAQAAPHMPVDVQAIGCDFYAFSGHKMLAPLGSGVLWGRRTLLDAMPPYMGGGGMIRKVAIDHSTYADVPARFEAGTPAVADAVGLGAAIEYLTALGMDRVRAHERELLEYALELLPSVPNVTVYGPDDATQRGGVISFTVGDIHAHDVAAILDGQQIAVRAGHHCTQPLMDRLGLVATTRASFYVYNTPEDIDRLVEALRHVNEVFRN